MDEAGELLTVKWDPGAMGVGFVYQQSAVCCRLVVSYCKTSKSGVQIETNHFFKEELASGEA